MDEAAIARYITETFADVEIENSFGYTFFFYKSDHMLPFATLISADYPYDNVSNLDRPGVFRLNIGIGRPTFQSLFGTEKIEVRGYDFTTLNTILPHPEYAAQSFVCVLNPTGATLEKVKELLAEAYEIAAARYNRKAH